MTQEYEAKLKEVIDGDTIVVEAKAQLLDVDIVLKDVEVRLKGVDTHETYGVSKDSASYQKGKVEKDYTKSWLKKAKKESGDAYPLRIEMSDEDSEGKFGRMVATVKSPTRDKSLNQALLDNFEGIKYE